VWLVHRHEGALVALAVADVGHGAILEWAVGAAAERLEARYLAIAVAAEELDEGAVIVTRPLRAGKLPAQAV
jgi:hypothetical protein